MHVERVNEGLSIDLASEDDTTRLGCAIAELAEPGVVIGLVGPTWSRQDPAGAGNRRSAGGRSRGDFEPHLRLDP